MADNCPYHTDHDNRLNKLERSRDELNDKITLLDKEYSISRVEITGALKNLEKLPETMLQISNTMVTIQNEIKASNTAIDSRIKSVESKIDSKFSGVDKEMKNIKSEVSDLDCKIIQINEADTINIRQGFKNWFIKNWKLVGLGVLIAGLYLTELVKTMVKL